MTALRDDHPHSPAAGPRSTATFTRRAAEAGVVVVDVDGEIDASNADAFAEHVAAALAGATRLVVDCRGVRFFAVEGYSAVQRINVMCAQAGSSWVLVPSEAVSRVLALCKREPRALRVVR